MPPKVIVQLKILVQLMIHLMSLTFLFPQGKELGSTQSIIYEVALHILTCPQDLELLLQNWIA